jgi:hypothetical protein
MILHEALRLKPFDLWTGGVSRSNLSLKHGLAGRIMKIVSGNECWYQPNRKGWVFHRSPASFVFFKTDALKIRPYFILFYPASNLSFSHYPEHPASEEGG